MARRRPLARELPRGAPLHGSLPGTALGEGGDDAAEATLTFVVGAETRGALGRVVLEGRSDAQHN